MPLAVPVSLLQLWTFTGFGILFLVLLLRMLSGRASESGTKRDRRSQFGILIQNIGLALAGFGPVRPTLHSVSLGMLLFLFALSFGLGHWAQLLIALPLFSFGTAIRTTVEDNLLEQRFGNTFRDYQRSTPALIPRLF